MLKVLGSKRLIFICLILAVLGIVAYAYYDFLVPAHEKSTQELETSKAAVRQKYAEVARLKEEYVLLQSQLRTYKELEARGFFNDQNRSAAVDKLDKLSKYAGLLKANLKFGSGQLVQDAGAELAGQVILKSPVTVEVKSIDDVDVYSFLKFIEEKFPGRVDVASLSLNRMEIFDTAILRKIGSGTPTPLVEAKISFDWLTMAPKNVVAPVEEGK
ncbi:MAG TPA: hypothetical protein DCM27_00885 [Rhodospirillaceae bacterium]|nr:hypothetical protein [Rhodospirillaceae bacterium]